MPDPVGAPQATRPVPPAAFAPSRPLAGAAPPKANGRRARLRWLDVVGATVLVLAAAFVVSAGTTGPLRLALTLPVLLFAPGYLLLQAVVVPPANGASLLRQLVASIGISPAVVGLLALSTSIVAGAFRPGVIVGTVTVGCLVFAAIAIRRRARVQTRAPHAERAPARPAAPLAAPRDAARAKSGIVRP